jgi:hypothetical protein
LLDHDDLMMHIEIRQALARYCQWVDHGDLAMAQSAYWPEATDHHGAMWSGNGQEYVKHLIERDLDRRAQGFPAPGGMHNLTTTLIQRIDQDHAAVQSYFIVFQPHNSQGEYQVALVVGRYLDQFERRDGEWRILAREVVNDYSRVDVPGPVWPSASWQQGGFIAGSFGPDDPGVQRFQGLVQSTTEMVER